MRNLHIPGARHHCLAPTIARRGEKGKSKLALPTLFAFTPPGLYHPATKHPIA
jgi:hypothetical protein